MKFKTSKKSIRDNYGIIVSAGYCSLQHLLWYEEPVAYSTGINGWSCDYYIIDNIIISTGYSPVKDKNVNISYSNIVEYDKKAKNILANDDISYEEKSKKINNLLSEFIEEVKKGVQKNEK